MIFLTTLWYANFFQSCSCCFRYGGRNHTELEKKRIELLTITNFENKPKIQIEMSVDGYYSPQSIVTNLRIHDEWFFLNWFVYRTGGYYARQGCRKEREGSRGQRECRACTTTLLKILEFWGISRYNRLFRPIDTRFAALYRWSKPSGGLSPESLSRGNIYL